MQTKVEMTIADIKKLEEVMSNLYCNFGRIVIHGDMNGDSAEDIAQNLEAEAIVGVRWWAKDYFPELAADAQSPEHELFVDDDEWEKTYASCGF